MRGFIPPKPPLPTPLQNSEYQRQAANKRFVSLADLQHNNTAFRICDAVHGWIFWFCRKFTSKHAGVEIDYVKKSLISKKSILYD